MATDPFDGPSVFHLGYIKSATTYLQNQIFEPETFGCALGGGRDSRTALVSWFITDDGFVFDPQAVDDAIGAMEAPVRAAGLVPVWSDETLLGDPIKRRYTATESLNRIARLPRDTKIIISIREQRAMVLSIYREFIRQGGAHPLTQFIGTGREPASYTPILKPEFLLFDRATTWCMDAFGPRNVLILPLEMLKQDPDAYFDRLFGFLGVPSRPVGQQEAVNVGLGAQAQMLCRWLNRFDLRNPLSPEPSRLRRLTRRLALTTDTLLPRTAGRRIEARWRAEIAARYSQPAIRESNARLSALTGLDLAPYGYL